MLSITFPENILTLPRQETFLMPAGCESNEKSITPSYPPCQLDFIPNYNYVKIFILILLLELIPKICKLYVL